jgi:hypothetical protein
VEHISQKDAIMTRKSADRENLIAVKEALVAKYETMAKATGSQEKRRQFTHHADMYRQQAANLTRMNAV